MEIPVDVPRTKSTPVSSDPHSLDLNIARARIALSLLAMLSMWVDPTTPGGLFDLTRTEASTLLAHLTYSVVLMVVLSRRVPLANLSLIPNVLDLFFATAISYLTQGQSGPSNVFFVFAIIAATIGPGLAPTIAAVVASVVLYLIVIAFSVGPDPVVFAGDPCLQFL